MGQFDWEHGSEPCHPPREHDHRARITTDSVRREESCERNIRSNEKRGSFHKRQRGKRKERKRMSPAVSTVRPCTSTVAPPHLRPKQATLFGHVFFFCVCLLTTSTTAAKYIIKKNSAGTSVHVWLSGEASAEARTPPPDENIKRSSRRLSRHPWTAVDKALCRSITRRRPGPLPATT